MGWEDVIKFKFGDSKDDKPSSGKKPKKDFRGFGRNRGGKDTMADFNISDFPRDACSSWQPMGRGCHNKAEWACVTCGAQWCEEHKFSGMDGHENIVYIGDDKSKTDSRLSRYDKPEEDDEQ